MEKLADTIGEFIGGLLPEPPRVSLVAMDEIAKEGRLRLWRREQRKLDANFHPSSLSDPCMRFDVVRLMVVGKTWDQEENPVDLRVVPDPDDSLFDYILHRRFDIGTALHEMEQTKYFGETPRVLGRWQCTSCGQMLHTPQLRPDPCENVVTVRYSNGKLQDERYCHKKGTWVYHEVRMQHKKLGIRARVDLPVLHQGRVYLGDIKTLGGSSDGKRKGRWEMLQDYGRPFSKDEIQVKIYIFLANEGEYFQYPVDEGILRYVHQGDPEAQPVHFAVARDPGVESWLHEYIGTVRRLASEGRWKVATCWCNKKTQARAKRCSLRPLCFPKEKK
jgi:hypothetical protein